MIQGVEGDDTRQKARDLTCDPRFPFKIEIDQKSKKVVIFLHPRNILSSSTSLCEQWYTKMPPEFVKDVVNQPGRQTTWHTTKKSSRKKLPKLKK
jgi:hypothetical protein